MGLSNGPGSGNRSSCRFSDANPRLEMGVLILPPFAYWPLSAELLPGNAPNDEAPFRHRRSNTLATSMALLAFAIVQVGPWGWASPGVVCTLVLSVVLTILTFIKGRKHKALAIPTHLFRIRSLNMATATALQSAGPLPPLLSTCYGSPGMGVLDTHSRLATATLCS